MVDKNGLKSVFPSLVKRALSSLTSIGAWQLLLLYHAELD